MLAVWTGCVVVGQEVASGTAMDPLVVAITVFVLAVFVGFEVITRVPVLLHTPLISGSNAISGITIIGALLAAYSTREALGHGTQLLGTVLGSLAIVFAMINVVGGYVVTGRMLRMFKSSRRGSAGSGKKDQ
jgi:H+-translocating NAD(P) transhydrogenase subunit alpha